MMMYYLCKLDIKYIEWLILVSSLNLLYQPWCGGFSSKLMTSLYVKLGCVCERFVYLWFIYCTWRSWRRRWLRYPGWCGAARSAPTEMRCDTGFEPERAETETHAHMRRLSKVNFRKKRGSNIIQTIKLQQLHMKKTHTSGTWLHCTPHIQKIKELKSLPHYGLSCRASFCFFVSPTS